jgi:hypothetical protein
LEALQTAYPAHNWVPYNRRIFGHISTKRSSKSQTVLELALRQILPGQPILSNYRFPQEDIDTDKRLTYFEFDVSF